MFIFCVLFPSIVIVGGSAIICYEMASDKQIPTSEKVITSTMALAICGVMVFSSWIVLKAHLNAP